jgi:hypothetical protein
MNLFEAPKRYKPQYLTDYRAAQNTSSEEKGTETGMIFGGKSQMFQ